MKSPLVYFFLLLASSLLAADLQLSGFGTLGGSISDKEYNYLRYINNEGTLKTNSLVGAQADITLNNQWKMTVQAKVSPAQDSDSDWDATVPWAFISYRPSNDWLIRVGQIRIPFYLNSQNMDVGITYDIAQLPYEVYSLSPINDGLGGIITKTFEMQNGELVFDLFYAKANKQSQRLFVRDDLSAMGGLSSGAVFKEYDVAVHGLTTEYRTDENDRFRFGVYKAKTTYQGNPPYGNFSLQPGIIPLPPLYYQPSSIYPSNTIIAFTLGADIGLGDGYRLTSEYAMRKIEETDTGPDAQSAYISVSKNMGKWTPYVSLAGMQTSSDIKTLYNALNTDLFSPNRQFADTMVAMEQKSVSLGFSYALSPTQKIKAQWTNARIGSVSNFLIDTLGDQAITHENINVFSLSYSMTF